MKRKYIYTSLTVLLTIFFVSFNSMASDYRVILTPRVSANGSYESNINLSSSEEDSDFITTISAGAALEVSKKLSGLLLSYDPSYSIYAENDKNDTLRHDFNLNAWAELTKTSRLQFRDFFLLTEDPELQTDLSRLRREVEDPTLEDPLLAPDTTVRQGREKYWQNTASLNYSNQFSKYGSFNIDGLYSRLENDDPQISDNEQYRASMDLDYKIHEMKTIGFGGGYIKGAYEGDQDDFNNWNVFVEYNQQFKQYLGAYAKYGHLFRDYDGDTPDYQVAHPTVGINYVIAEDFTLDFGVGYFWRKREDGDDTQGTTIDGNLGKSWPFKRGAISLNGSSGFDSDDFGSENLGFNQFYTVNGRAYYDFTQYIKGDVSAGYLRKDYLDTDEDRDNILATARLSYRILRLLSVSIGYSYRFTDSNISANDIVDQRVFFSINSVFNPIKL